MTPATMLEACCIKLERRGPQYRMLVHFARECAPEMTNTQVLHTMALFMSLLEQIETGRLVHDACCDECDRGIDDNETVPRVN